MGCSNSKQARDAAAPADAASNKEQQPEQQGQSKDQVTTSTETPSGPAAPAATEGSTAGEADAERKTEEVTVQVAEDEPAERPPLDSVLAREGEILIGKRALTSDQLKQLEEQHIKPLTTVPSYKSVNDNAFDALRDVLSSDEPFFGIADGVANRTRWESTPVLERDPGLMGVAEKFHEQGGRVLFVAPETAVTSSRFNIAVRRDDLLIPACHEGMNRSQVLHLVLTGVEKRLRTGESEETKEVSRVALPHGAESGYDPHSGFENLTMENYFSYILGKILPRETPGETLHQNFHRAFGVDKRPRVGQATSESNTLELNPDEDDLTDSGIATLEQARVKQRGFVNQTLFNVQSLRDQTGGRGRVIFFCYKRAARIIMTRLMEIAGSTDPKAFEGVCIVCLPHGDPLSQAGSEDDMTKYKAAHPDTEITSDDLVQLRHRELYAFMASFLTPVALQA